MVNILNNVSDRVIFFTWLVFFVMLILAWLIVKPGQDSGTSYIAAQADGVDCTKTLADTCRVDSADIVYVDTLGKALMGITGSVCLLLLIYMYVTRRWPFGWLRDKYAAKALDVSVTDMTASKIPSLT